MEIMTRNVCYDIMQSGIWIAMFRRSLLLPSSELNIFLEVIIARTASCVYCHDSKSVSCPKSLQNNRLVDSDPVCLCLQICYTLSVVHKDSNTVVHTCLYRFGTATRLW
jgi:hypothetical protein